MQKVNNIENAKENTREDLKGLGNSVYFATKDWNRKTKQYELNVFAVVSGDERWTSPMEKAEKYFQEIIDTTPRSYSRKVRVLDDYNYYVINLYPRINTRCRHPKSFSYSVEADNEDQNEVTIPTWFDMESKEELEFAIEEGEKIINQNNAEAQWNTELDFLYSRGGYILDNVTDEEIYEEDI